VSSANGNLSSRGPIAPSGFLKVALVQTRTPTDQSRALDETAPLIRQACAAGANLIITPEATNLLQRDHALLMSKLQPMETDIFACGIRALAAELHTWILIGSGLFSTGSNRAANRSVLIDEMGAIVQTYDKLHMFDVDLPGGERHRESELYEPGASPKIARTPWGPLGLTICYDLRFPYLYRILAKAGAAMIATPAAFTATTGEAHWEVLLRARAIETGAFVLAAGQGGVHEDGRTTWGHSMVIDPWGRIVAQSPNDAPGIVLAELDLDAVNVARRAIPSLAHDRDLQAEGTQ